MFSLGTFFFAGQYRMRVERLMVSTNAKLTAAAAAAAVSSNSGDARHKLTKL